MSLNFAISLIENSLNLSAAKTKIFFIVEFQKNQNSLVFSSVNSNIVSQLTKPNSVYTFNPVGNRLFFF